MASSKSHTRKGLRGEESTRGGGGYSNVPIMGRMGLEKKATATDKGDHCKKGVQRGGKRLEKVGDKNTKRE